MLARLQSVERAGRCHQRQAHGAAQISFTLQPLDLQMQSQSQIAGVVVSPVSTDSWKSVTPYSSVEPTKAATVFPYVVRNQRLHREYPLFRPLRLRSDY